MKWIGEKKQKKQVAAVSLEVFVLSLSLLEESCLVFAVLIYRRGGFVFNSGIAKRKKKLRIRKEKKKKERKEER